MLENNKSFDLVRACARPGRLRDVAIDMWRRTRLDWSFAGSGLSAALRAERGLGSRERRFVRQVVFDLVRHARRVDEALAAGRGGGARGRRASVLAGAAGGDRAPDTARVLAVLVLEHGLAPDDAARAASASPVDDAGRRAAPDWHRVADIDAKIARIRDPARRIALAWSLPDWLARALLADHGDDAEALAAALTRRAPTTLRVNTLATTRDALARELADAGVATRRGALSDTALIVVEPGGGDGDSDGGATGDGARHDAARVVAGGLLSTPAFRRGAFELQDEGSQIIAALCGVRPGMRVVDLCAGAGGKSLALAAAMANRGRITAADIDRRKLAELRRRARRAGVSTIRAVEVTRDPGPPPALDALLGAADRVLVDAPCTGTGTLRRHPEHKWRLSEADVGRHAADQLQILLGAAPLLAPGGRLVYATCSVLSAENKDVIDRLRAQRPELEPVALADALAPSDAPGDGDDGARRDDVVARVTRDGYAMELYPHRHGCDGFNAFVLERRR